MAFDSLAKAATPLLEVSNLSVAFGKHTAVNAVNFYLAAGEVVVILGANGAGKSTLLKSLGGMVQPHPGAQVSVQGSGITGVPAHLVVEAGVALVPEGRGIFGELSVRENLLLGGFAKRAREELEQNLGQVFSLFPRLQERQAQIARTMSGGEQQMVAIGRALMSKPKVLMLDEPSLGLSPILSKEVFRAIARVAQSGVGVLLVEQNARLSLAIADRGYVMENGRMSAGQPAAAMLQDSGLQRSYLGGTKQSQEAAQGISQPKASTPPATAAPRGQAADDAVAAARRVVAGIPLARWVSEATQRAQVPSGHAMAERGPRLAPRVATTDSQTLDTVCQSIEAAAQRARVGTSLDTGRAEPHASVAAAPRVEVWRRAEVEVYKRNSTGQMVKE